MSRFPDRCCVKEYETILFRKKETPACAGGNHPGRPGNIHPTSAQTITTFDAPGAGTGPFQGTYALDIDPSGTTIGFFRDANDVRHGFIRSKDGTFTIFDAPGAGTAAGQGTRAYATNSSGTITGHFTDSANVAHGYVRSNQGVITVFDAPGAGTGPGQGTFPFNSPNLINPDGSDHRILR